MLKKEKQKNAHSGNRTSVPISIRLKSSSLRHANRCFFRSFKPLTFERMLAINFHCRTMLNHRAKSAFTKHAITLIPEEFCKFGLPSAPSFLTSYHAPHGTGFVSIGHLGLTSFPCKSGHSWLAVETRAPGLLPLSNALLVSFCNVYEQVCTESYLIAFPI